MNKKILYIAIGVGVLYFISRRAKKNLKKAVKETADNLGSQLQEVGKQEVGNDSLTELQNQTAKKDLQASARRGFELDEVAQEIIKDYFKTIKDKQVLNEYQKMSNKEMDRLLALANKPNANLTIVKAVMRNKVGISYEKYMELSNKMKNYVMPKIMASMPSDATITPIENNDKTMSNFDYGL